MAKKFKKINKRKIVRLLFPFLYNEDNFVNTTYTIDEMFDKFILNADEDLRKHNKSVFRKIKKEYGI